MGISLNYVKCIKIEGVSVTSEYPQDGGLVWCSYDDYRFDTTAEVRGVPCQACA